MKSYKSLILAFCITAFFIPSLSAQSLKGQTFSGTTGLYSIPTGRIGWERSSDLGLDFGYHAVINERGTAHIPTFTASLFKWVELSFAMDIQPDYPGLWNFHDLRWEVAKNDDLLLGFKVALPTNLKNASNPAVAIGGSIQAVNVADDDYYTRNIINYNAFRFYAATTYAGTFFTMPAETTVVIGKTFYSRLDNNSDIDFGMGFDLVLLPKVFQNYIHWIIDFANFDYSDNSWPNSLYAKTGAPWYRGILNTGLRVDLSQIRGLQKFKFVFDVAFNDLFDSGNRSFTVGAVFGVPVL
jgi:hypothetical protein